jgi:hypothetical protein
MRCTGPCPTAQTSQQDYQFNWFKNGVGKRCIAPHALFSEGRKCCTAHRIKGVTEPENMRTSCVDETFVIGIDEQHISLTRATLFRAFGPSTTKSTNPCDEDLVCIHDMAFTRCQMNFGDRGDEVHT